ncbi:MAG: ComEC family competence protein [Candidatus Omnitrophota bacterium]|nr:MAG: ComEC family competence protein [Candidatus Omnitrophota bacterium]
MKNYYILLISIVFICGLILTSLGIFAFLKPQILTIFIIALFALLILFLKRNTLFVISFFLLVFLLGIIRYNAFNVIDKKHIKNYIRHSEKTILVQGRIIKNPIESGKKATFILKADSIESEGKRRDTSGLTLVNLFERKTVFRYGDIVLLEGFLRQPFSYNKQSNFDYRKYLANKRIYSILNVKKGFFVKKIGEDRKLTTRFRRIIYSLGSKFTSHIETYLTPPYSSILTAILLGRRQKIPQALNSLFARTGTFHILAISGLHVGIIYFALKVVLKIFRVQRNLSIILSVLFLACFAILTGARPSILRATTMFSILAFGEILKRKISIFNLIGLSGFIILMMNPNQVFDTGFILSYTAVLSIIYISPVFYKIFHVGNKLNFKYYLLTSVSVSLAAWVGLFPLVAYYFGLISPVAVAANLVVIPLLLMIMGSGILFLSLGFLSRFLATVFSQSIWFFLVALVNSIRFLKNIPLSYLQIRPPYIHSVILYYIILSSGLVYLRSRKPL